MKEMFNVADKERKESYENKIKSIIDKIEKSKFEIINLEKKLKIEKLCLQAYELELDTEYCLFHKIFNEAKRIV